MTYENDKTPGRYKRIVKRGFNDVIYVIQQQDKNFYPAVLCKNKNAKAFLNFKNNIRMNRCEDLPSSMHLIQYETNLSLDFGP